MKIICDSNAVATKSKTARCEKCSTDYLYQQGGGAGSPTVACPRCGWYQLDMVSCLKLKRGLSMTALLAASGAVVAVMTGHIAEFFAPAMGMGWLALSAVTGLGSYFLANPNAGFQSGEGHAPRADASVGLALNKLSRQEADTEALLQNEIFRYLRQALVVMAGIDGNIDTEELEAIARLYYKVTDQDVLVRTLENEAEEAIGEQKKLLKSLAGLSPYLASDSKQMFVKSVMEVAAADGRIDDKEVELARAVGKALGVSDSEVGSIVAATRTPTMA